MKKSKFFILTIALVLLLASLAGFVACNDDEDTIDYSVDNDFDVTVTDDTTALVFAPANKEVKYGLLFYVGTGISPDKYSYLGNTLAKKGYLVYIPKFTLNLAYQYYAESETAFSKYPDVRFFIGGHSNQGSDAALRRINETERKELGAIFFAPITSARYKLYDKDGNPVKDTDGNEVWEEYSLSNTTLPTLYLEGDKDAMRNEEQIAASKRRMSQNCTFKTIENGNHTSFAQIDEAPEGSLIYNDVISTTIEQKNEQRTLTVFYVLQFLKNNIA